MTPVLPGQYFVLAPVAQQISPVSGVVAAVFRSDDGPLASIIDVTTLSKLYATYGTAPGQDADSGVETVAEALRGGASLVRCYRHGTGGVKATKVLLDTQGSPAQAVDLTYAYPGKGGNLASVTLQDSVDAPSTIREFRLFINSVEKLVVRFTKGGAEGLALVAAIAASGTTLLTAAIHAAYVASSPLAAIASPSLLTGGTSVTTNAGTAEAGVTAFEGVPGSWNVLAMHTTDTTIQTAVVTMASLWEGKGIYKLLVLGDPPSVTPTAATRYNRAAAFNQQNLIYVIDSFTNAAGSVIEGGVAAGRVAGMRAAAGMVHSITGRPVVGAVNLTSGLSMDDRIAATTKGALTFTFNDRGTVTITQDITSFTVPSSNRSTRWGKSVRVARRYGYLIDVSAAISDLLFSGNGVDNDDAGRASVVGAVLGVIGKYKQRHYFTSGSCYVDPDNASHDDIAYLVHALGDNDQIERLIQAVQFP